MADPENDGLALRDPDRSRVVRRRRRGPLRVNEQTFAHLVTLLNWASSPYVKRLNLAFVMIDAADVI